ncbi:Nn.00g070640.m01.CDS01 [Neocucurbitaria sp. VM-36]
MSVSLSGPCLPPSSSLPPVRRLISTSEKQLTYALEGLQALYCPLRIPSSLSKPSLKQEHIPVASTPTLVDSGYASEDENDDAASEEVTAALRADPFERTFVTRWLTSLLSRVEELDLSEEARNQIVDDAAYILSSISGSSNDEEEEALTRDFTFHTTLGNSIKITLNDAPLSGIDHTDVGLQSWGASIVLSNMMCADPKRFNLASDGLPSQPRIIELGAGTGLVSLTLARLLPDIGVECATVTATDYHPAVLENCRANVVTNFPAPSNGQPSVETMILDWSTPPPDLRSTADLLIASDVVYAPEHAAWLRDCAAHLLTPGGTFWLMVTVRKTGKFEGIPETVEAAFRLEFCPRDAQGRQFKILEKGSVEKRRGIGRGDETGYNLYRLGWA